MTLTVAISDDGVTVTASDLHPIVYSDVCRHVGDLVLRLYRELNHDTEEAM